MNRDGEPSSLCLELYGLLQAKGFTLELQVEIPTLNVVYILMKFRFKCYSFSPLGENTKILICPDSVM